MAAESSAASGWVDLFLGLPPQLQGAATVLLVGVVGVLGYLKFVRRLNGDAPAATDYAVGDPTTFADMSSVKKLVTNVDALTMHMMKSAVASDGVAGQVAISAGAMAELAKSMTKLCDLVGQLLLDMREQREEQELEDARQRGYDEAMRQRAPAGRRTPAKKPGGRTG